MPQLPQGGGLTPPEDAPRHGTTLLVSGFDGCVKKTDFQGAFGDFGQILRIDLEVGRAFLEFDDERDASDRKIPSTIGKI